MTQGKLVPNPHWGVDVAKEFEGTLEEESRPQKLLCITCVREGTFTPPQNVVFCDGNTYCSEHV